MGREVAMDNQKFDWYKDAALKRENEKMEREEKKREEKWVKTTEFFYQMEELERMEIFLQGLRDRYRAQVKWLKHNSKDPRYNSLLSVSEGVKNLGIHYAVHRKAQLIRCAEACNALGNSIYVPQLTEEEQGLLAKSADWNKAIKSLEKVSN